MLIDCYMVRIFDIEINVL